MRSTERRWSFTNREQTGLPDVRRDLPVMYIDRAERVVRDGDRPVTISSEAAWAVLLVLAERSRNPESPCVPSTELKSLVGKLGYYGLDLAGESVTRLRQLVGNSGRTEELIMRAGGTKNASYRLQRQVVFVGEEPNQQIAEKEGGQVITAGKTTQEQNDYFADFPEIEEDEPNEPSEEELQTIERESTAGSGSDVGLTDTGALIDGLVRQYLREIGRFRLLSSDEERILGARIADGKNAHAQLTTISGFATQETIDNFHKVIQEAGEAKKKLWEHNLRLVVSIAKKYTGGKLPLLDLIQEGNLGLERAVEKFDHTRGFKFSTYASWWIRQTITRAIYESGRTIRVPIYMQERLGKLDKINSRLRQELGREPSNEEIAAEAGLTVEKVRECFTATQAIGTLDQLVGEYKEDTPLSELVAGKGWVPEEEADMGLKDKVDSMLRILDFREKGVLRLRFGLEDGREWTLEEVGKKYGVTRERIRQIENKALKKLRDEANADGDKELRSYYDEG